MMFYDNLEVFCLMVHDQQAEESRFNTNDREF